ncbi:hypothetical protein [Oceanicoccus sagamiensis]|nr:hypothetical protein [Oceanicoccus sagamiensis]
MKKIRDDVMRVMLLLCLVFAVSCSQVVGMKQHQESLIGEDIEVVRNLYVKPYRAIAEKPGKTKVYSWNEKLTPISDGNKLYSYENPYRECTIYWVVDKSDVITKGYFEGSECR